MTNSQRRSNPMNTEQMWDQYLGDSVSPENATAEEIHENVMRWTQDDVEPQDRITAEEAADIANRLTGLLDKG
jgi:hypothetical protein